MSEPIRIAQILGTVSTGGVASMVISFYKHIDHTRYQFDFYTYDDSPYNDEILALGGRIIHYPKVFDTLKCVSFLKRKFIENNYQIVHVHLTTLSFVPLYAAKLAKVPIRICHAHSTTHKQEKFKYVVKNLLRPLSTVFATDLFACSELSANWLYRKKASKATLVRNAVDLDLFNVSPQKRLQLKAEYGLSDHKVVGFIGRFEVQKNVSFLLRSFAELIKKRDDVKLAMVGDGSKREEIEELIDELGITKKVIIFPEIKDVWKYYALFDVFALPSCFEGLPLVAVEAQASGLGCILSSNVTPEVDLCGDCVFLPIDKPDLILEWATFLDKMIDRPRFDYVDRLKDAGYDIEMEADRLADKYDSLLCQIQKS